MTGQWEQQCNSEALRLMGIPVLYKLDADFVPSVRNWVENGVKVEVNYPDETASIIDNLIQKYR
ncbi:hypothetical protein D3C78_1214540 [compost metagenome]